MITIKGYDVKIFTGNIEDNVRGTKRSVAFDAER
jgi:hypothetical protein